MNMPTDDFLTVLYVEIDNWYKDKGAKLLPNRPGPRPVLSDSEILTLAIAQPFLKPGSERKWVCYVRHDLRHLFPRPLSQSEYNRRVRYLWDLFECLRKYLVGAMEVRGERYRVADSAPVHVRHWRRYGPGHLMMEEAALGYCAAKRMVFYGYRVVVLVTLDGIPTDWLLIPANACEREAAQEMLDEYRGLVVLGDKGFVDAPWHEMLKEQRDINVLTQKRVNQRKQNPRWLDRLLKHFRSIVETSFSQLCEQFDIEFPRALTLWGLITRVRIAMTGMTLAAYLNKQAGNKLLSVAEFAVSM